MSYESGRQKLTWRFLSQALLASESDPQLVSQLIRYSFPTKQLSDTELSDTTVISELGNTVLAINNLETVHISSALAPINAQRRLAAAFRRSLRQRERQINLLVMTVQQIGDSVAMAKRFLSTMFDPDKARSALQSEDGKSEFDRQLHDFHRLSDKADKHLASAIARAETATLLLKSFGPPSEIDEAVQSFLAEAEEVKRQYEVMADLIERMRELVDQQP